MIPVKQILSRMILIIAVEINLIKIENFVKFVNLSLFYTYFIAVSQMAEQIFQRELTSQASALQQIRTRFRSTKDLHTYLSDNCGYLLPKASKCKLIFLQAILYGQKKCLKQKEVPAKTVPHWPGLTVKNVYRQVWDWPNVRDYLPEYDGKLPERDFFFKVLYTLHPDKVEGMIEEAGELRNKGQKNLQDRQWSLMMPPEWINELLKHDFVSSKKGRGSSSILISQIGQARIQAKRRKVVNDNDQTQMNNPMNEPMAGDGVNQMQMNDQNAELNQSQNFPGSERKNTFLEAMDDNQDDNQIQQQQRPPQKRIGIPKLSNRAAQIMSSSTKKTKKRNENEFRSQGILEVQEILDGHESKYGSAIGEQLGPVQEQEEVKVGAGAN